MNVLPMEPGLHGYDNPRSYHLEVLVSLVPVAVWATVLFGWQSLLRILLSTGTVFLLDCLGRYLQKRLFKRPFADAFSLRAAVVGLLIVLPMPSNLPIWMLLLADLLAALLLGLIRCEAYLPISLPALVGSCLLLFPAARQYPLVIDSEQGKTLLTLLRSGEKPALTVTDMLLGRMDGGMGEVASLLLLLGGGYLLLRRSVQWQIPLAGLAGAAITAYVMAPDTMSVYYFMGAHLFSGSFLLVLIYFAADRTSAPISAKAGLVYGALYGVLTILFRMQFGIDGALPAILLTSVFSYPLDRFLTPIPFGGRR